MNTQTYAARDWSDVVLLTFVYALYLLVVTAPVGFAISAYKVYRFKRSAERSTAPLDEEVVLIATHHEWLVRTFIIALVLTMAALGNLYYGVGFVVAALTAAWWFYRLIRGAAALVAHRDMPATICTKAQCYGQVASAQSGRGRVI
jgi:uncharacterized membrane protein